MTATILFLPTLFVVLVAIGLAASPRRIRPPAARTLRNDVLTGVAVLRGLGETNARITERRLNSMRPATKREIRVPTVGGRP